MFVVLAFGSIGTLLWNLLWCFVTGYILAKAWLSHTSAQTPLLPNAAAKMFCVGSKLEQSLKQDGNWLEFAMASQNPSGIHGSICGVQWSLNFCRMHALPSSSEIYLPPQRELGLDSRPLIMRMEPALPWGRKEHYIGFHWAVCFTSGSAEVMEPALPWGRKEHYIGFHWAVCLASRVQKWWTSFALREKRALHRLPLSNMPC